MIVKTSRFGDKEVPDDTIITFPEGVIGFRDATRFVMFECSEDGLFKWLQSCDRPELAFVIAEATLIAPNYRIMIGEKERALLKVDQVDDVAVCLILIIPDNYLDATANLLGPLVMNAESRLGMQVVVVNPDYSARHRLFAPPSDAPDGPPDPAGAPDGGDKETARAGA